MGKKELSFCWLVRIHTHMQYIYVQYVCVRVCVYVCEKNTWKRGHGGNLTSQKKKDNNNEKDKEEALHI